MVTLSMKSVQETFHGLYHAQAFIPFEEYERRPYFKGWVNVPDFSIFSDPGAFTDADADEVERLAAESLLERQWANQLCMHVFYFTLFLFFDY